MKKSEKKAAKKAKAAMAIAENTQVISSTSEKKDKAQEATKTVKVKDKAKKKILKKVSEKQGATLVEEVVSHREVKWLYPEDITTPLARKSWRQKARHEINKLKSELFDILDKGSAEYKAKEKELQAKEKAYLKSAAAV